MLTMAGRLAARTAGASVRGRRSRSDSGAEAVEFALILPVLLTLLFGIITMGTVFYHYEMLVSATEAGCRYFAAARGTTTPYSGGLSEVENYATGLSSSYLATNTLFTVNGTACSTDTTCIALMSTAGLPVTVTAHYPCTIFIMGVNLAPGCTLTQQLTESLE
jgi:Flp pilus assembly protein TadG